MKLFQPLSRNSRRRRRWRRGRRIVGVCLAGVEVALVTEVVMEVMVVMER